MAFSEAQKAQIRRYLGYPDVFRYANTRLESALDVVGGRPDTQALIESDLTALAVIETQLTNAVASGGIKKVDEIEFFEIGQTSKIRSDGRRICGRLSITLGVPLAGDAFGEQGYGGDEFMGTGFQYGSGGMFGVG